MGAPCVTTGFPITLEDLIIVARALSVGTPPCLSIARPLSVARPLCHGTTALPHESAMSLPRYRAFLGALPRYRDLFGVTSADRLPVPVVSSDSLIHWFTDSLIH